MISIKLLQVVANVGNPPFCSGVKAVGYSGFQLTGMIEEILGG